MTEIAEQVRVSQIKPLDDRVLVEVLEEKDRTAGGLYIPDDARERPTRGKVLAVGPGERNKETGERMPLTVKKGDIVLCGKYAFEPIKVDGKKVALIRECEILGTITFS